MQIYDKRPKKENHSEGYVSSDSQESSGRTRGRTFLGDWPPSRTGQRRGRGNRIRSAAHRILVGPSLL
jgi:hypothetical protein